MQCNGFALEQYRINQHEKEHTQKRGGDATTLSIDVGMAERLLDHPQGTGRCSVSPACSSVSP